MPRPPQTDLLRAVVYQASGPSLLAVRMAVQTEVTLFQLQHEHLGQQQTNNSTLQQQANNLTIQQQQTNHLTLQQQQTNNCFSNCYNYNKLNNC